MVDLTLRGQCEEATRLLQAGKPVDAAALCRRILEVCPKHAGTYAILAQSCLQTGQHEEAANLYRRVLGVDPEHTLAYASMGILYEERGLYEEALWQMLRAFELSPGNAEIRRELVGLYGAHSQAQPARCQMTRAALARTYLRGQLYPKAIGELRELVAEQPQRYDLRVALAEALWHDHQQAEAETVCQAILADLPNCLKANLILGQIWLNSQRDEEARVLFQRAQELDPENRVAQALFGAQSPLPQRTVRLPFAGAEIPAPDLPYLVEDVSADQGGAELDMPAEPADAAPDATREPDRPAAAGAHVEGGLSLWDVEFAYVSEHPTDFAARLDLARKLYGAGALQPALEQYGQLVQGDYEVLPEVLRDLNLLARLHSESAEVQALLAAAQERSRQEPGA